MKVKYSIPEGVQCEDRCNARKRLTYICQHHADRERCNLRLSATETEIILTFLLIRLLPALKETQLKLSRISIIDILHGAET